MRRRLLMSNCWPKIWGTNNEIYANDLCSVNVLKVKKGGHCSYHTHVSKHNVFFVISGQLKIATEYGDSIIQADQVFTVFAGTKHKFVAMKDTVAIEVMFVKYDPKDIARDVVGFMDQEIAGSPEKVD
jgi:mannose-6-phosphate isomerase-like protein (cupin superfamily)